MSHDVLSPLLPDNPSEWKAPTPEQIDAAMERNEYGVLTADAARVRRDIMMDRWYLVENTFGWKSGQQGRAGATERYFTLAGIERPVSGVWGIYALYDSVTQNSELAMDMTMNAVKIGAMREITTADAQKLYDRIAAKLGPFRNGGERIRKIGPRPGTAERSV